jgi:hypothetical protein
MEKEIERRVKVLVARNQDTINEETGIHSSETEEDMKEYLQQVLDEVKSSKEHSDSQKKR